MIVYLVEKIIVWFVKTIFYPLILIAKAIYNAMIKIAIIVSLQENAKSASKITLSINK